MEPSPSVSSEEAGSRIAQIQAAIQRGEARAARQAAGVGDEADDDERPSHQLTPEEELALNKMFVQPDDANKEGEKPAVVDVAVLNAEYRINKTLEFCPDGEMARQILQEMKANGTVPRAQSWNMVIDAFGKRGALDDALGVFKEMQEALVAADGETYDVLARPSMLRGEFMIVERLYVAKASDSGGGIGAESLTILLDAYANGRPSQTEKAEVAFRGEIDEASEKGLGQEEAVTDDVLRALRRALGTNRTCDLCWEFGIDPARCMPVPVDKQHRSDNNYTPGPLADHMM